MPHRFLHIAFNWRVSGKVVELEPTFSHFADDRVRYAPNCWIVWTSRPVSDFYYALRPQIADQDAMLIVGLDMNERNGWLPKPIWDWIDRKRFQTLPPPAPLAPPPPDYKDNASQLLFGSPQDIWWHWDLGIPGTRKGQLEFGTSIQPIASFGTAVKPFIGLLDLGHSGLCPLMRSDTTLIRSPSSG